jgi:hypothetical protein
MKSNFKTTVIECPVQKRLVEVTYKTIGSWFNRQKEIKFCPAMQDCGGCDRQCKKTLEISRNSDEWSALR